VQYDYKIEAWNIIGHSEASELHDVVPFKKGCDSVSWLLSLLDFLMEMRMYSVNAIGAITFLYYYLRTPATAAIAVRKEKGFRPTSSVAQVQSAEGTMYRPFSVSAISTEQFMDEVENKEADSTFLPDMTNPNDVTGSVRYPSQQIRRQYSTDRCEECGRSVTRSTRHQCGMCLHIFCTKHTAIHPHLESKVPFMGTVVFSACGINSKCRCYTCSGLQFKPDSSAGSDSTISSGARPQRLWRRVRSDILLKKTLRIWKRKESTVEEEEEETE